MNKKKKKPDYVSIWATIDFDTIKQRINHVTHQIDRVLQKYESSTSTGDSGKRNN
ncbi:MAG: hypothetical protein DSM106950_04140 [Stigonema ocellatum SAG 48.90 = DSM 106950]|nr:hypothetical protein [Stigonema ocellatum SAG 48.90 = DSM 106950]